jgi:hypothetical protein
MIIIVIFAINMSYVTDIDWNEKAKRLLKSELVKRGISTEDLVVLLKSIDVEETKASIDSKISRGTFSAAFLIQCLNVIGCKSFVPEVNADMVSEPIVMYKKKTKKEKV